MCYELVRMIGVRPPELSILVLQRIQSMPFGHALPAEPPAIEIKRETSEAAHSEQFVPGSTSFRLTEERQNPRVRKRRVMHSTLRSKPTEA